MLWLLLSGSLPTQKQVDGLSAELRARGQLPQSVVSLLKSLPKNTHPMTQFSMAVLALQPDSRFAQAYQEGVRPVQATSSCPRASGLDACC